MAQRFEKGQNSNMGNGGKVKVRFSMLFFQRFCSFKNFKIKLEVFIIIMVLWLCRRMVLLLGGEIFGVICHDVWNFLSNGGHAGVS